MVASSTEPGLLTLSSSKALVPRGHGLLTRAGFPESTGSRLPGVDGLRAIAAMWVVFFHITAFSHARFGHHFPGLDLFLRSGSTGVSLFLVLSGFCLYIPFAGGRQHRFHVREF